jgi:hypothetical protein
VTTSTAIPVADCARALSVAHADAVRVYRNLTRFRIEITLHDDGWHVEYYLRNPDMLGGGPHYVISADTGEIVSKKYYQ